MNALDLLLESAEHLSEDEVDALVEEGFELPDLSNLDTIAKL